MNYNKLQHKKINENEAKILMSLYESRIHRQLIKLYYLDGNSLEKCADLMQYSKRQIERIKNDVDKIAFYGLLTMVASDEVNLKIAKIREIINGIEV